MFHNTTALAVAVAHDGSVFVAGTAQDASSGDHNAYTLKINAAGTAILWGNAFDGPDNLTTGAGLAEHYDPLTQMDQAVLVGTYTITDPTMGPVGPHAFATRWTADGTNVDYAFYYTFTIGGMPDQGSHGHGVALNNASTASAPGALGIIAGDILTPDNPPLQNTLSLEISNGLLTGGRIVWATTLGGASPATLNGSAFNPDDTVVLAGTVTGMSGTAGLVVKYPTDGGMGTPAFQFVVPNATALTSLTLDSSGNIWTAGTASSSGFAAEVNPTGTTPTLVGAVAIGVAGDTVNGIAVDSLGNTLVAGTTTSATLSTDGTTLNGSADGFLGIATLTAQFVVTTTAANPDVAGTPFDVTVTVQDSYGDTLTGYTGTIHFSSADPNATLPADYTFQPSDAGQVTFSGGATLYTAGTEDVTVTDTANSQITGTTNVNVVAGSAVAFNVIATPTSPSGTPFDVTVVAVDAYGNTDTNYAGTIHFTTSDMDPGVVLPPDYTFQSSDAGMVTFFSGATLITSGSQTITVTDVNSGITGSVIVTVM
jgi:hypothetical protein